MRKRGKDLENKIINGGLYRHYKGQFYRVMGTCRHSESLDELVIYEALYENKLGKIWVRPLDMFLETVKIEGKHTPRFKLVEEDHN